MPSIEGLKILTRDGIIDDEVLYKLLVERTRLVKPLLYHTTLDLLGDMRFCKAQGEGYKKLSEDSPKVLSNNGDYSLKTPGIFTNYLSQRIVKDPSISYATGLTRDGNWILITVKFSSRKLANDEPGSAQSDRVEIAHQVEIEDRELREILEITGLFPFELNELLYQKIWDFFLESRKTIGDLNKQWKCLS